MELGLFMTIKSLLCTGLLFLTPLATAHAEVQTNFDEGVLNPNVNLDIPNAGLANMVLDTVNEELDVTTTGNTDLWTIRNNAPFAWTSRPTVAMGDTWIVETELRFDTDVLSSKTRVAGITFYGGPDGSGGSTDGMDFGFGINNWDDRDPTAGYQAAVEVQGFGDNSAGDSGGNLTFAPWTSPSVFLRIEVTENGASDAYTFMYKQNAADPWTTLGNFNSTVDNSRVALFFKNSAGTSTPDRSAAFTYFTVQRPVFSIPTLSAWGLLLLSTLLLVFSGIFKHKS